MKKLLMITALACLCACSNEMDQEFGQAGNTESPQSFDGHKIDRSEAIEIANLYFSRGKTRTSSTPLIMEYIVDHTKTRSGVKGNDTVAYVLNRGANDGFVMISSDDRVYPILAYSQTGTFSYEKGNPVETEFIGRLGAYLEENAGNESQTVTSQEIDACYAGSPVVSSSWDQRSPWNKYIVREHPGCPAGCVAVATGMVMTYCKPSLIYHGIYFDFSNITAGLKKNDSMIAAPSTRIVGGDDIGGNPPILPDGGPYSYDQAVDYCAKLLYWIGKDVNMDYHPDISGTVSTSGYSLLKNQRYVLSQPGLISYNVHGAIKMLTTDNIIYMRGRDIRGRESHAWVADACTYCVDYSRNDTTIANIHCKWGWGGNADGYYSGKVFAAGGYHFSTMQYFGIKVQ